MVFKFTKLIFRDLRNERFGIPLREEDPILCGELKTLDGFAKEVA